MSEPSILSSEFDGTPLAAEARGLDEGAAWTTTRLAGLQFYTYNQPDGLDGTVRPISGDRLHLMRRPENPADCNAVEVWWKNSFQIGHLPADIAAEVAPLMDEGKALRAYVTSPGDGRAWRMQAVLIGPAVAPIHARTIEAEAVEPTHKVYGPYPDEQEIPF